MNPPSTFAELVGILINFIALLVPVVFALTFILLSWGVIKAWVLNGGDESSVKEGKSVALVGVIALVVMFGIWGLLAVLRAGLGLS